MKVKETGELAQKFKEIENFFEVYPITPIEKGASMCPVCKEPQLKERYRAEKEESEGFWIIPFYYCTNCGHYYQGRKYWKGTIDGIDLSRKYKGGSDSAA